MTFSIELIIPGFWSKETSLLFLVAGSLIARSISDIYLIQAVTDVEGAIVSMNRKDFKRSIIKYAAPLPLVSIAIFSKRCSKAIFKYNYFM